MLVVPLHLGLVVGGLPAEDRNCNTFFPLTAPILANGADNDTGSHSVVVDLTVDSQLLPVFLVKAIGL